MVIVIKIEEKCPICKQPVEHFEAKKNHYIIYCTNQKCKYQREIVICRSIQ